jgi:transposase
LALVIEGANRHDMKLLCATLEGIVIARPEPTQAQPQHLCLDAGYDYPSIREQVETYDYLPHIRGRGQEKQEKIATPGFRARRWVVERTHSWLNRSRRLLVRSREEGRALCGVSPSGLRSTHVCQSLPWEISSSSVCQEQWETEPFALETVCDEEKEAVCAMLMQSPKQKHSQQS